MSGVQKVQGERVWLAEKPSFAKELGKALGNCQKIDKYAWRCNGGIIVAAAGHLVELAEPHDYKEEWKEWKPELLPMIPDNWEFQYRPISGKEEQLKIIHKYAYHAREIIIATDAGREGEYIAWSIIQYLGLQNKPKKRLWSSGANAASILKAAREEALLNYAEKFPMAEAARIRAESDWVEGLNLTRLLTTRFRPANHEPPISVGRVQTAALAIIVRRQREIENFKSEKYYEIMAEVTVGKNVIKTIHAPPEAERIKDAAVARRIAEEINQKSVILDVKSERRKEEPPSLFESSSLQIKAYNLWGWPASKTEALAQALYDKHKLISYPRTDGVHLETEQWTDVGPILTHLKELSNTNMVVLKGKQMFPDIPSKVPDYNKLTPRDTVFNSAMLEKSGADHHGIIPTTEPADLSALTDDERKLYLLIVRQFLAQLYPDCTYQQTSISWKHGERKFSATGRAILEKGWRELFEADADDDSDGAEEMQNLPMQIPDKTRGLVSKSYGMEKQTVAPPAFTEGSIISAMRDLTKVTKNPEELKLLKHASVLGTKSTWGETIKKLKDRLYIVSASGKLIPTKLGLDLVTLCEQYVPTLVQPTSTALLEQMLNDIEKRSYSTTEARKILQGRNVDAIKRCLAIPHADLRAPDSGQKKMKPGADAPRVWKDFEGGSWELDVPFDQKEEVRALGGRFNGETKKWHLSKKDHKESDLKARGWIK